MESTKEKAATIRGSSNYRSSKNRQMELSSDLISSLKLISVFTKYSESVRFPDTSTYVKNTWTYLYHTKIGDFLKEQNQAHNRQ